MDKNEITCKFSRCWAMPNADTFSIPPIKTLLERYIKPEMVVIDPFARDAKFATITNDLNPQTSAQYHMDALDFLNMLVDKEVKADLVLFDPPYSARQIQECYQIVGRKVTQVDTQYSPMIKHCRNTIDQLLKKSGLCISFGWNSAGQGRKRNYEILEIALIAHGGTHNDTIVLVEEKL